MPTRPTINVNAGPGSQVQVGENISTDQVMDNKPSRSEHPPWSESGEPIKLVVRTEFDKFMIEWEPPNPVGTMLRVSRKSVDTGEGRFTFVPFQLLDQYMYWRMEDLGFRVVDKEGDEIQEGTKPLQDYPKCGHSACRQNWCDTGELGCVLNEDEVDAIEELRKELTESGYGSEVTDPDNYEEMILAVADVVGVHRKFRDEIEGLQVEVQQIGRRVYSELSTAAHEAQASMEGIAERMQKATDES